MSSIENSQEQLPKHENPYFPKLKTYYGKKIAYIGGAVFCVAIIAYILLALIFYRNSDNYVKVAVFTGNVRISDETLVQTINEQLSGSYLLLIPKKNIYALRTKSLEKKLVDRFGLTEIHIDKIYSQKIIHVTLKERPIQFTATVGESTFFLASDGTILEDITQQLDSYKNLFNVAIPPESILAPDDTHTHSRIPDELLTTLNEIQQSNLQIDTVRIVGIKTDAQSMNDIKLITDKTWYIYIDKTRDIQTQIDSARLVFVDKIKGTDSENTLQYIDVRVPGKAYYK
ncbi:MAG: hypothetical protein WC495_00980 [Patescibacteria group bacterium]|jgi:hypothetical protein